MQHIDLPASHTALVDAVLDVQPNTVVVLTNGSAVAMPWASRAPAIVEAWLGGQAGGGAIADVLLGRVNPAGRLSETFPVALADTPAYLDFPGDGDARSHFTDRLFTGYRSYDARGIEPLFPFGHGLSYTSFEYSGLRVDGLNVTVTVANTGERAGAEVVQLYVRERAPHLRRPDKELRAFAKPMLEPGAQREVSFQLEPRDFASFDTRVAAWRTDSGEFDILVGASSRDIRLQETVTLEFPERGADPLRSPHAAARLAGRPGRARPGRAGAGHGAAVRIRRRLGRCWSRSSATCRSPSWSCSARSKTASSTRSSRRSTGRADLAERSCRPDGQIGVSAPSLACGRLGEDRSVTCRGAKPDARDPARRPADSGPAV